MFSSLMGKSPSKKTEDEDINNENDEKEAHEIETENPKEDGEKGEKRVVPNIPHVRLNPKLTQRRQIRPDAPSYLMAGPKEERLV